VEGSLEKEGPFLHIILSYSKGPKAQNPWDPASSAGKDFGFQKYFSWIYDFEIQVFFLF